MSKRRISVVVSIALGVVGLFGLLLHLHPLPTVRHTGGLFDVDNHAGSMPQQPSPKEERPIPKEDRPDPKDERPSPKEDPPSYTTLKVPGEIDGFTPHVWQTTGPKTLTDEQKSDMASWREKHPFFAFTLMTDEQGDSFVREHFSNRSDIVDLFLPIPIVKADLFRLLVLVAKGGIYADIDVFCDRPISEWLPQEHANSVNLIIGLEFDFEFRGEGVEVASQFANWVMASKRGNKHLMHAVDTAVAGIYAVAEKHNVDLEHLELWMFPDVVNIAGPKRMTLAVLESLSGDLDRLVDDRMISNTKEPRLVGDVLIMPNNAFAASQAGHPTDRGPVLVTHHYAGSWKASADDAKAEKEKMESAGEQ
jgi:hypothetical protein